MKLQTLLLVLLVVAAVVVLVSCKQARYLEHYPDEHPLGIIGDYNSDSDFTKKWQPFSLAQMQALVEARKTKPK
jgi:hypothetical protein